MFISQKEIRGRPFILGAGYISCNRSRGEGVGCVIPPFLLKMFLPHWGPTWEFQLGLKSCNLASWATKWHNYVPVDPPPHRLRNRPTRHIDSATDPPTTRRVTWNLGTLSYLGR